MRVVEQRVRRLVATEVDDAELAPGGDEAGEAVPGADRDVEGRAGQREVEQSGGHVNTACVFASARALSGRKVTDGSSGP
jgi:hypothetical protein